MTTSSHNELNGVANIDFEAYKAQRLTEAQQLFNATRSMYSLDELKAGVYAEVHNITGEIDIIGLQPKTEARLETKMESTSHSVFDELTGRHFYMPTDGINELPELMVLVKSLGLGHRTSKVHGKYFEIDGIAEFCVHGSIRPLTQQVYEALRENFGLHSASIQRGRTVNVEVVHYDKDPYVEPELTFTELTTGFRPIETGVSNGIYLNRKVDLVFDRYSLTSDRDYMGPKVDVYMDFFCSDDRTHSLLGERALEFMRSEDDLTGSSDHFGLTEEEITASYKDYLVNGSMHYPDFLSGESALPYRLLVRYMIDHVQHELKLETIVNPDPEETNVFNPDLIRTGAILITAAARGLAEERQASSFKTTASLILNNSGVAADGLRHSKTFELGPAPVSLMTTTDGATHTLTPEDVLTELEKVEAWISSPVPAC